MEIEYSPLFARQYKKLPLQVQKKAESCEDLFRANPFDSRLKTHKLNGPLKGFHAFSITGSHRIIFDISSDQKKVRFYQVGTHDIYD